ncbi:MAG: DUF1501 domain-containing protein [Planctomycetia bacterium]|nr:DUF1501 domain-containing protein [Planctomycetia bacterium]
MFTIPGNPVRSCEGVSRREWLRVGGLGTVGLSLPVLAAGRSLAGEHGDRAPRPASFGRAKSCIVLFLFGAPAHQDLWDLKPKAPREVRGEFRPIPSSVPDLFVGEHLPELAQRAHRYALIRSVTHPDNTHTVAMHYMLSGVRHARPATNPRNAPDDFPCFGAIANYVAASRLRAADRAQARPPSSLPAAVSLNAPANQVSANNHIFPGFFAGFLGAGFDPLFVPQNADVPDYRPLPSVEDRGRLVARRQLLAAIAGDDRLVSQAAAVRNLDGEYARAFEVLTSPGVRRAFSLEEEPPALRAAYGATPFGQGCLLARRLVESGVSLVTVNWERDDAYWDTHKNNFADLKNKLCPNLDKGLSALLDDLTRRGLLEETLVVCLGEFGRTPHINNAAGRDHWAPCNSVVLAGAGIPGGAVYGSSDRLAAYPASNPVTPQDLSATIYHLLGIDPLQVIRDPLGREYPLSTGEPVWDLV